MGRERVRNWLERRLDAARLDQAAADSRGYEAQDDYDKAAAEEWVCRALNAAAWTAEQTAFAGRLKDLLNKDEYHATSIHDDARFERHVRGQLRTLGKMTKANAGVREDVALSVSAWGGGRDSALGAEGVSPQPRRVTSLSEVPESIDDISCKFNDSRHMLRCSINASLRA